MLGLQTSRARNGKLDGKRGGNKRIVGWEDTVMGSGVSSVRSIWCGAVLGIHISLKEVDIRGDDRSIAALFLNLHKTSPGSIS